MNYDRLRRDLLALNNAPDGFLVEIENISINFEAFPQTIAQPSVKGSMVEVNITSLFGSKTDNQPISVCTWDSPGSGSSIADILRFRKETVSLFVRNLP